MPAQWTQLTLTVIASGMHYRIYIRRREILKISLEKNPKTSIKMTGRFVSRIGKALRNAKGEAD